MPYVVAHLSRPDPSRVRTRNGTLCRRLARTQGVVATLVTMMAGSRSVLESMGDTVAGAALVRADGEGFEAHGLVDREEATWVARALGGIREPVEGGEDFNGVSLRNPRDAVDYGT